MTTNAMAPRVTSFAPQFLVDDLERSIEYYKKLGFTFGEPWDQALKERNNSFARLNISHFQCLWASMGLIPGATRVASLRAYPWLSYFAPSALGRRIQTKRVY